MKELNLLKSAAAVVLGAAAVSNAFAQAFPTKPVKVFTIDAGGGLDITIRAMAPAMQQALGQPIIVENRGSTTHLEQTIQNAAPDGYSLMYWANGFWLNVFMMSEAKYDPVKDFAPITITHNSPNALLVTPALPVKTVQDLVKLAKSKPGELNIGRTANPGGSNTLAAVLFAAVTDTKFNEILYKNTNQIITDIAAGRIEVGFPGLAGAIPLMKTGKVRALAITASERSALTPDLPTITSIYKDYDASSVQALFAPKGTPQPIIARLLDASNKAINNPEIKEKLLALGLDPVGSTPQQLTAFMVADMKNMGKVIKDRGFKAD